MEMENKIEKKDKEIKVSTFLWAILFIAVIVIIINGLLVYGFNTDNVFTRFPTKYLPYPAAMVGHRVIKIEDLRKRVKAIENFYENQNFSDIGWRIDFSTPEGKKRLKIKEKLSLEKLVEEKIIETEANNVGIKLTKEMVSEEVKNKLSAYGQDGDQKNNLSKLYGWTMADFEENIVKPALYQEKLAEKIKNSDARYTQAKEKIKKAQADLKNGRDFETVVGQYSEGDSVKNNGELGWFSEEEMLPEISATAFKLKVGEISDIIESSLGFHIIQIESTDTINGMEKVKIKQIFTRIPTFADWLKEKEKDYSIYIPLKGYSWNSEENKVEFKDEELRKFEENISTNSPDDISIIF